MKSLLLIAAFFFAGAASARSLPWQWARAGACTGNTALASCICLDAQGNIYVAGTFSQSMDLDTITLTSSGNEDIFVAKYDANGNIQWAKTAGGTDNDGACAIGVDARGNVYVSGYFRDTAAFGNISLISKGNDDVFIARYSPAGDVVWARRAGGLYEDRVGYEIGCMKVTNDGHIYITGQLEVGFAHGTADFGNITVTSPGESGIFLAKYDTSGNVIWAKSAGGVHFNYALGITTDAAGNTIITGEFEAPFAYFDSIRINTLIGTLGSSDMFVAKYDSGGKALWANAAGGDTPSGGSSVVTDNAGNVFVIGNMNGNQMIFGNGVILHSMLSIDNSFVAKYNASGQLAWAKSMGINPLDNNDGYNVVIDNSSSLYITGQFAGHNYMKDTVASYGGYDAFVAKLDSAGNGQWFTHCGGTSNDFGTGVALDGIGNVYSVGNFTGGAGFFGNQVVGGNTANAFVAKLSATTGIWQPMKPEPVLSVYPDPAADRVTVGMGAGGYAVLRVTDVTGRVLVSYNMTGLEKINIDTRKLVNGLYLVTVQGEDGSSVSKKIIVQH